jgi:hypothetical protein
MDALRGLVIVVVIIIIAAFATTAGDKLDPGMKEKGEP